MRAKCPQVDDDLLRAIFRDLKRQYKKDNRPANRDVLALAQYAQKLRKAGFKDALDRAKKQVLASQPEGEDPDAEGIE